ncbi:MAG: ATP-binding protein [Atopobiaceae bacterium]|nr:ATP-binding protein [Atopobiaceae bacterium]
MLIRATVENYKSFKEPTELVMISSSKIRRKEEHVRRLNGAKVLKYAAVYGANAAGKSNLIDLFSFVQRVLREGLEISFSGRYCRNDDANRTRKSVFELQFTVGGHVFAYGFSAILSEMKIMEEWLYELHGDRSTPLLVVDALSDDPITSNVEFSDRDEGRFRTYADDFDVGTGTLFLSELNRSKRYASDSAFQVFVDAYRWLTENIVVITPMGPMRDAKYLLSWRGMDRAGRLLASFDTGVSGVCPEAITPEALADAAGEQSMEQILLDANSKLRGLGGGMIRGCLQTRDGFFFFDISADGISNVSVLRLRHGGVSSLFDFREESDGTRRLFDLMGMLLDAAEDTVYVVDELERSLHPMLVRHFLELFMESNSEGSCQIIFSSHEASIMDQELFRRDEIWFVDRGANGNSKLYSLDRFKDRFDKDITKAYLEGRYGAVPAFVHYGEE